MFQEKWSSNPLRNNLCWCILVPEANVDMAISATYFTNNGTSVLDRWVLSYDKHLSVRNICLGAFGTVINIVALILIQVKPDMKLAARIKISTLIITDLAIAMSTAVYGITGVAHSSISTCWFVSFTFVLLETASHSTVAVISILNCIAVCSPVYFRSSMAPARVALILVGMWVTAVVLALSCVGFDIRGGGRCLPLALLPTHGLVLFVNVTGTCDLLTIALTVTICFKLRSRRTARNVHETSSQRKNCLRTFCQVWSTRTREHNVGTEVNQSKPDSCPSTVQHQHGCQDIETGGYLTKEYNTNNVCNVNRSKTSPCGNSECTLSVLTTKDTVSYGAACSSKATQDKRERSGESGVVKGVIKKGTVSQTNTCGESAYWAVKTEKRSDVEDSAKSLRLRGTASEPVKHDNGSSLNIVSRKSGINSTSVLKCRSSKFKDSQGKTSPEKVDYREEATAVIEVVSLELERPLEPVYGRRAEKDVSSSRRDMNPTQNSSLSDGVISLPLASEGSRITCGFEKRTAHSAVSLSASNVQQHSPTMLVNFRTSDFTNRRCKVKPDTIFSNPRPGSSNNPRSPQIKTSSFPVSSRQHQSLHASYNAPQPPFSSPPTVEMTNQTTSRIISTLTFLTMWSGIIHFVSLLILLWMVIFENEKQAFLVSPPGLVSSTLILFNALTNPVIYVWSLTKWKTLYGKIMNSCTQARR